MPENPGIPAAVPRHLQERLPALPRPGDPARLPQDHRRVRDHSERLGDAFEYLLSVLGSQGDAGQFRTPRHIIDFIVAILDPKARETVLDPACGPPALSRPGTSSRPTGTPKGRSTLHPRRGPHGGTSKADISPDMVRLSLVNM